MITKGENENMNQKNIIKEQEPKWKKIESDFIKLDKIGDSVEGVLISKDQTPKYWFYTVRDIKTDETKRIHGSTDLDSKMAEVDIDTLVRITYVKDQKTANLMTLKVFDVEVPE